MATHSSVLAWRIPGTGEPGGLPSMGSHRVGRDWSDLAAAELPLCMSLHFSDCWFWAACLSPSGNLCVSGSSVTLLVFLSVTAWLWFCAFPFPLGDAASSTRFPVSIIEPHSLFPLSPPSIRISSCCALPVFSPWFSFICSISASSICSRTSSKDTVPYISFFSLNITSLIFLFFPDLNTTLHV